MLLSADYTAIRTYRLNHSIENSEQNWWDAFLWYSESVMCISLTPSALDTPLTLSQQIWHSQTNPCAMQHWCLCFMLLDTPVSCFTAISYSEHCKFRNKEYREQYSGTTGDPEHMGRSSMRGQSSTEQLGHGLVSNTQMSSHATKTQHRHRLKPQTSNMRLNTYRMLVCHDVLSFSRYFLTFSEPEAGEVSPPVGAGVNSNSWTFKFGPSNSKQGGPGELPDKFIIPGSPAIISIRQEPPNSQIDKSDFITFGKKEETKKKKKKKKGNKTQEKKEKGNSTTENSDQWGVYTERTPLASFCNNGRFLLCSNSQFLPTVNKFPVCTDFRKSAGNSWCLSKLLNRFCLKKLY